MSDTKALVGMALVAALSLAAAFGAWSTAPADRYALELTRARFASIESRIPAGATLRYLSDLPVTDGAGQIALLTAQYVLAPHLLLTADQGGKPAFAVGNFSRPADYAALGATAGYRMTEDLGAGVILYRRVDH